MESEETKLEVRPHARSGMKFDVKRESRRDVRTDVRHDVRHESRPELRAGSHHLLRSDFAHNISKQRSSAQKFQRSEFRSGYSENPEFRATSENSEVRLSASKNPGFSNNSSENSEPAVFKNAGFRSKASEFRTPAFTHNDRNYEPEVQRAEHRPELASKNERRDMLNERTERKNIYFERRDMQSGKSQYESEARGSRASTEDQRRFSVKKMLNRSAARNIRKEIYESESGKAASRTVEETGRNSSSRMAEFNSESKHTIESMRSVSKGDYNKTHDVSGSSVGRGSQYESSTSDRRHSSKSSTSDSKSTYGTRTSDRAYKNPPVDRRPSCENLSSGSMKRNEQVRVETMKRPRTNFTPEQLKALELEFSRNKYLVGNRRQELSIELDISEKKVCILVQIFNYIFYCLIKIVVHFVEKFLTSLKQHHINVFIKFLHSYRLQMMEVF